ncbi:hypothetical protein DRN86_01310, partial [Candidatus Geothermarchaeota archaeon]
MAVTISPGVEKTMSVWDIEKTVLDMYFGSNFGMSYEEALRASNRIREAVRMAISDRNMLKKSYWEKNWPRIVRDVVGSKYLGYPVPVMAHGPPGIGKSASIMSAGRKIAEVLGLDFSTSIADLSDLTKFCVIDARASQLEYVDVTGIPSVSTEAGMPVTRFVLPNWLPRNLFGLLFFDELALA